MPFDPAVDDVPANGDVEMASALVRTVVVVHVDVVGRVKEFDRDCSGESLECLVEIFALEVAVSAIADGSG